MNYQDAVLMRKSLKWNYLKYVSMDTEKQNPRDLL